MAATKKNKWLLTKAAQESDGIISTGGWVGQWSADSEPVQRRASAKSAKVATKKTASKVQRKSRFSIRRTICERLGNMSEMEYDLVEFLVELPREERPPPLLSLHHRMAHLLNWADEANRINDLYEVILHIRNFTPPTP